MSVPSVQSRETGGLSEMEGPVTSSLSGVAAQYLHAEWPRDDQRAGGWGRGSLCAMAHSFQAAVTARLAESLRHGNGSVAAALAAAMTSADARIMVVRVARGGVEIEA